MKVGKGISVQNFVGILSPLSATADGKYVSPQSSQQWSWVITEVTGSDGRDPLPLLGYLSELSDKGVDSDFFRQLVKWMKEVKREG
jgi:hypothetical protein